MCWLYQLVKNSSHQRGGILNWEHASTSLGCRQAWRAFSLSVMNVGGPSQVGGAILGLEDLSSIRKQAEDAMGSKPVNSSHPWPLHQLLPPHSCPAWVPAITIFDSELLELWMKYTLLKSRMLNWIDKRLFWLWLFNLGSSKTSHRSLEKLTAKLLGKVVFVCV